MTSRTAVKETSNPDERLFAEWIPGSVRNGGASREARQIAKSLDRYLPAPRLAALNAAIDDAEGEVVRVAVVGRFNSGKSSLINRLIGEALVPTNRLTETGTAIWISAGDVRGAVAIDGSGARHVIELSNAGLKEATALLRNGVRRSYSELAHKVEITVDTKALPSNLTLIDTPGLDDSDDMNRAAHRIAAASDHVIFLLTSSHFLSDGEISDLRLILQNRDPSTIHLVINCFVGEAGQPMAQEFLDNVLPIDRQRLAARAGEMALETAAAQLSVIRAVLGADCIDFGVVELLDKLSQIAQAGAGACSANRQRRLAACLKDLGDELRILFERHAAALDKAKAARQAQRQVLERKRAYLAKLGELAAAAVARHVHEIEAEAKAMAEGVTTGNLKRDDSYRTTLQAAVTRIGAREATRLYSEASDLAQRLCGCGLQREAAVKLAALFQMQVDPIAVPNAENNDGSLAAGAVAGACVGSFVPGIGTAIGAFIGAAVQMIGSTLAARQHDVAGLKQNVVAAAGAASQLRQRAPAIVAALTPVIADEPTAKALESAESFVAAAEAEVSQDGELRRAIDDMIARLSPRAAASVAIQ